MRVVSAIALIGATTAKPVEIETTVDPIFEETTLAQTEVVTTTPAPKRVMPTLPPNYKPIGHDNKKFREFAIQNHFPPIMQEREMMAKMGFNAKLKMDRNNPFFATQQQQQTSNLQCMECSGQSYDQCYMNARLRTCPQQERSCFLEVRYRGSQVVSVQSGCAQEVACINNMKQNFYDFNEYGQGGVNHLDTARHDCKVFSNNPFANSVCRNCCFSDNCTNGWQPSTFEDWNIQDRREVKKQMQLFDQFVYAPDHWDRQKQKLAIDRNRNIQYVNSLAELNREPTFADLRESSNKNIARTPTVAKKQPRDHVANFRSKQLAQQRKEQQQRQHMQQQQRQQMQNVGNRFTQPKVLNVRTTKKAVTTRKPVVRRPQYNRATTTKRVFTTTQKPTTKQVVADEDFMALIAQLEAKKNPTKAPAKPVNNSSMTKKKNSSKKTKPSVQLKSAVKTTKAPTTKAPTTTKAATKAAAKKPSGKGPWSHLPPWKQRQLQAARQKAIAAAKAKKAAAMKKKQTGPQAAQPQMMKFSSSVSAPAKLEEGEIVEVKTNLSDEDFGKLIASIDTKDKDTDFDAIISAIEADN